METQIVHFPHEINRLTVHVELRLSTIDCKRHLFDFHCVRICIYFCPFFVLSLSQFVLCGRTTRMRQAHSTNSSSKKNPKEKPKLPFLLILQTANRKTKDTCRANYYLFVFGLCVRTENPQAIIFNYIATAPKLFYAVVLGRHCKSLPVRNQTWSIFSKQPLKRLAASRCRFCRIPVTSLNSFNIIYLFVAAE